MEKQDEILRKQLDKINDNLELIHENIEKTNEKMDELKEATNRENIWSIQRMERFVLWNKRRSVATIGHTTGWNNVCLWWNWFYCFIK